MPSWVSRSLRILACKNFRWADSTGRCNTLIIRESGGATIKRISGADGCTSTVADRSGYPAEASTAGAFKVRPGGRVSVL